MNGKELERDIYSMLAKGDSKVSTQTSAFLGICLRVGLFYQDFKNHTIMVHLDHAEKLEVLLSDSYHVYNFKRDGEKITFLAFEEDFQLIVLGLCGKGINIYRVDDEDYVEKVIEVEKKAFVEKEEETPKGRVYTFNPVGKTPEEQATWLISTYDTPLIGIGLKDETLTTALNPGVRGLIDLLENKPLPTYSDYRALKSNGNDESTKLNMHDFRDKLTNAAYDEVDRYFVRDKDKKTAYRWLCRGVRFKDAICKAIESGNVTLADINAGVGV